MEQSGNFRKVVALSVLSPAGQFPAVRRKLLCHALESSGTMRRLMQSSRASILRSPELVSFQIMEYNEDHKGRGEPRCFNRLECHKDRFHYKNR